MYAHVYTPYRIYTYIQTQRRVHTHVHTCTYTKSNKIVVTMQLICKSVWEPGDHPVMSTR